MPDYAYRIVNVFVDPESPDNKLTGNPLCVFEGARGLDPTTMQALAQQFNLSETTFLLPSDRATARVRIYTPAFEMPFAGHPTLGSAHVVRALNAAGDRITLEMKAGVIPVTAQGDDWTLKANAAHARPADIGPGAMAAMLGIGDTDIADPPLWVNTGSEQLLVRLATPDAVRHCQPNQALIVGYRDQPLKIYVWAEQPKGQVLARFFFPRHGAVIEDFGTGSAAANLGGWYLAQRTELPLSCVIRQGEAIGRPARLVLDVDENGDIFVTGRVVELGRGTIAL